MKKLVAVLALPLVLGTSLAQANLSISETGSLSERVPGFYHAFSKSNPKILSFLSCSVLENLNRARYPQDISQMIASVKIVGYESVAIQTTGCERRPLGIVRVRIKVKTRDGICQTLLHETKWIWEQRDKAQKPDWYFIGHDREENISTCKQK